MELVTKLLNRKGHISNLVVNENKNKILFASHRNASNIQSLINCAIAALYRTI